MLNDGEVPIFKEFPQPAQKNICILIPSFRFKFLENNRENNSLLFLTL